MPSERERGLSKQVTPWGVALYGQAIRTLGSGPLNQGVLKGGDFFFIERLPFKNWQQPVRGSNWVELKKYHFG